MKIDQKNIIFAPGIGEINWNLEGFNNSVLWTAREEVEGKMNYDKKYMCIEPIIGFGDYFGSKRSMIEPGGSIAVSQTISLAI